MNMNKQYLLNQALEPLRRMSSYFSNRKYVNRLSMSCSNKQKLSKEQKASIQSYYKNHMGKKLPDYKWHEYYYCMTGHFSEKYIPNYVIERINRKIYNYNITTALDDKNLYYVLFPDICQPKALLQCVNGFYYINNSPVSKEVALRDCENLGEVIIKPSFCSCSGNGVKKLIINGGREERSGRTLSSIIDEYGNNFVIQEVIRQHDELARLCSTSINTVRIVTYRRSSSEIAVVYSVMRIGKKGSEIDNTTAGGFVCKISDDGLLDKYAVTPGSDKKYTCNEDGLIFENYQIPMYDAIVEKSKQMHYKMPHLLMVGWDFTVNESSEVVFIEMNAPFGLVLHQLAAGPGYGEYTDEIFDFCFKKNK